MKMAERANRINLKRLTAKECYRFLGSKFTSNLFGYQILERLSNSKKS
jgi:hypothetical protein